MGPYFEGSWWYENGLIPCSSKLESEKCKEVEFAKVREGFLAALHTNGWLIP